MPFIEGLADAPGSRTETEAAVREILSQPIAASMQTQYLRLPVTGAPVGQPVEEVGTDGA